MATLAQSTEQPSVMTQLLLFGQRAVQAGFISEAQLEECLGLQKKYEKAGKKVPKIGEILVHKGHLSKDQVAELLRVKASADEPPAEVPPAETEAEIEASNAEPPAPKPAKPSKNRPVLKAGMDYAADFMIEERLEVEPLGDVYLAREAKKDRPVVMIVIDPSITADSDYKQCIVDQMKVMARLEHPHVQKLYTFGKSKGCYYIALEYVRGDLAFEKLRSRRPQDYAPTVEAMKQLVDALKTLSEAGIVHGQISPTTITLAKDQATLMRAGIPLRLDHEFQRWTKLYPVYMAPEVVKGGAPDVRSDIFSLGTVFFHLLAGTAAYRADSPEEAPERVAAGAPSLRKYNQRVPAEAADLIGKMIAPDPADRFQDLDAVRKAIVALPSEVQTRVTMNYAQVLGEQALKAPTEPDSKPPGKAPTAAPGTRPVTTAGASGANTAVGRSGGTAAVSKTGSSARLPAAAPGTETKKSTRAMNYSELVAQMNVDAKEADVREASSKRSGLSGVQGRAYRRLEGDAAARRLPPVFYKTVAGVVLFCATGGAGFYFWAVSRQHQINEVNREAERKAQDDKRASEAELVKAPPEAVRTEAQFTEAGKLYDDTVKAFNELKSFDRGKLEQVIALANRCVARGDKNWPHLGDAHNLLGRLHVYWFYTDRFGELQASVKKDHQGIAIRELGLAKQYYARQAAPPTRPGAPATLGGETAFRLLTHPWMPEFRESPQAVFAARNGAQNLREVRYNSTEEALADVKYFELFAKRAQLAPE